MAARRWFRVASGAALGVLVALAAQARESASVPAAGDGAALCESCHWEKVATCEGFSEGLTFDASGRAWLVGLQSGGLYRIEGDGCEKIAAVGPAPNGAKVMPDGDLYIADRARGLVAFDPETGNTRVLADQFGYEHVRGFNDLVPDAEGGIYVTEPYGSSVLNPTGRVFYLPAGSDRLETVAGAMAFPNGVALSPDQQWLYVAEYAENRILALPSRKNTAPHNVAYVFARLQGGIGPDGLTTDRQGRVYAAHFMAGSVEVFDPAGRLLRSLPLPEGAGPMVTNIALHDGWLYAVEAAQNQLWRLKLTEPE